jgi:hypothetical protein
VFALSEATLFGVGALGCTLPVVIAVQLVAMCGAMGSALFRTHHYLCSKCRGGVVLVWTHMG